MLLAVAAASSTTSVPTWLALVLPVLAALVSRAAGIAGTLLGGRTATHMAERNATLARRAEQRCWNRERQEKAYLTLLERRDQLVKILFKWSEVGRDVSIREGGRVTTGGQEIAPAERAFGEALAVVELAGTTRAVELARTWGQVLGEAWVETWVGGKEGLFEDHPDKEKGWRDQFVALIREELGVDD
jgi:hypothetical protein